MRVVVPAYILSELKAGFAIGAVLFLPFLLIDMVTAAITTSIGMFQLPPVVVSTPLKILLFVMVDGWNLLAELVVEELLKGAPMTPDMVAELLRQLMKEAMILVRAAADCGGRLLSFVLSLVQTLTSLQEQSLTTVPRLAAVALILLVGMPWFLERMAAYTRLLLDFHRYLG